MKTTYGMQTACKHCGQDIEFLGRKTGWIDRGAGRQCLPFTRRGEIVRPKTKHAKGDNVSTARIDPLIPQRDHVAAWLDRMGTMVFIADEHDGDTLNPGFTRLMWAVSDSSAGRVESASVLGV